MTASPERQRAEIEALGSELESLSYSVSHDLRAPVRAVIGFTKVLEDDYAARLDDEGRRLLAIIMTEAERTNTLIDGLLTLSRLGRQPMEHAPVDMLDLVHEAALELTDLAVPALSQLEVGNLPGVSGDRAMLRQVWSNLLSNAVKSTSRRAAPRLQIYATLESAQIVYHVRDNGIGFDTTYADKLFGLFQKLHADDAFPGSGIGLAQVKRILHRHGGDVWADAQPGEGATFSFGLPTATGDE